MRATCSSGIMLPPREKDSPSAPGDRRSDRRPSRRVICSVCGKAKIRRGSGLDRLRSRRRRQIHTGRSTKGRLIRHADALALAILALAVAMILTSPGGVLMAAIGFPALETAGSFTTSGAAVLLAPITVRAEVKHRPTGRKATHTLTKDCGTSDRHRFGEGALDNRRRSWKDDSR